MPHKCFPRFDFSVDGLWGSWLSWSACSDSCGGGLKTHSRLCLYRGTAAHGKDCFGNATEVAPCGNRECPGMHINSLPHNPDL